MVFAKVLVCLTKQLPEFVDVDHHLEDPHHGQFGEIRQLFHSRGSHARASEPDGTDPRMLPVQSTNQIGSMQIAAWLAHREENLSGSLGNGRACHRDFVCWKAVNVTATQMALSS
jgi:hypothetical protein